MKPKSPSERRRVLLTDYCFRSDMGEWRSYWSGDDGESAQRRFYDFTREFMRELRKVLNRPWSPPTPVFVVKVGAKFIMRTESSLALNGRRCIPKRFLQQGFEFQQPDLAQALRDILVQ